MELKVWVDGIQRVVCGVTEATTCQEVVIALAQAIGRTGRYTLIEKWRDAERFLAPYESPVASLNTWGQYAGDVQLVLHRTGPSLTERPPSEGPGSRLPERGPHRQSLPPMAKFRPQGSLSLRRREPRRKSLTFAGAPRSLRDILSGGRLPGTSGSGGHEVELKRQAVVLSNGHTPASGMLQLSGSRAEDLTRLIRLQGEKLGILGRRLEAYDVELRTWGQRGECVGGGGSGGGGCDAAGMAAAEVAEEIACLEKRLRRSEVEMEEEEFWASELEIERESERQLDDRLQEMRGRVRDCEDDLRQRLTRLQSVEAGLEAERTQLEQKELQQVSEEELRVRLQRISLELKVQTQHAVHLESSCRALERSLGQCGKRLQDKQHELEQLTKELRQVNLQQFIQQTGTKVTVLPVEPGEEEGGHAAESSDFAALSGSLKRPGIAHPIPGHLRVLQSGLRSALNPEGIYV
ncbi:ras association domain-containing protein 8 [Alosa sapidissima]|uniref:ras association domain-containing protein 8 n=1 Tax=Alosa sapidissima TaxID=34773 RepID=UPI001C094FC6|nr:ras association domain-containing protein 8 [Alosa sapidissima]XP_041965099.1 ras association domain-containing protein 8 [Alosa sapidissima]XP_041965100.1 ras association domain-containing protein 8 [Alosa sapidissima]XP_041965102.1 ras association domain-containing protein 8 [Alosa sapidissima]